MYYKGKDALALKIPGQAKGDVTLAILKDIDFHNGVIEATISGQPLENAGETAHGFVGIALRAALNVSKVEGFYSGPTNGGTNDQIRRNHSSQYISILGYPEGKLRKETPNPVRLVSIVKSFKVKIV
ncbi:hypothetical protein [Chryseobacterium sp. NFX27]|uniref:hypothetical protein n=1 Tax=Chryseobacterium sp. NFX27 TaxID=2819618 RepID=UPI003CF9291D